MRKWNSEDGMSLVEATIILMMLSILTAVISPSISDYVNDARNTKVKEDVEAIGVGIARLLRDIGIPCLSESGSNGCTVDDRVDLLIGDGKEPNVTAADFTVTNGTDDDRTEDNDYNWRGSAAGNAVTNTDFIGDQLLLNAPTYTTISGLDFSPPMNTTAGLGWRGPYVSGPIGADPWGYMYQANTLFLAVARNAGITTTGEGERNGGWNKDVFVISSGQNAVMETVFAATTPIGSTATGDDVIYVIQGSTK